jgi:metallo-beta-lactamase family protein
MKITFLGADQRTTGSKHLLEINGRRLLLECGMFQGHREKSIEYSTVLPFDPGSIHAMVLSHAHIDHSGVIPVLCRDGFHGAIHCTDATADLCNYMLLDTAHIQEQDAAFVNKKRAKKNLPPIKPIYTQTDAADSLKQFSPLPYSTPTKILDGVTVTFLDAGHILGSALVLLDLEENGRHARLVFTGDLGRGHNDILRDPEIPDNVDVLMTESTYGNRDHEPLTDVNDRICRIIQHALEHRGKIIIPSFAVGRTQQILYTIYQLTKSGRIPALRTYVDSPLSINATAVFRAHPECFNDTFRAAMTGGETPFTMPNLTYTGSVADSIAINDIRDPCIIISASGMAEAGRICHHIKNNIEDPRNTILIVGWCAAHTVGGHLASGDKQVSIFGEPHRVRCHVETINAFSGHADRNELRAWTSRLTGSLKKIFVVHGEPDATTAYAETLRQLRPQSEILVPQFNDSVEF